MRRTVLAVAAILAAAAGPAAGPPPGVRVTPASDGRNVVRIDLGGVGLAVDGPALETSSGGAAGVALALETTNRSGGPDRVALRPAEAPASIAARVPVELRGTDRSAEIDVLGPALGPHDAFVFLPDSGTLVCGDLCASEPLAPPDGANLDGWIRALERLARRSPKVVVPGRGPIGGPEVLDRRLRWLRDLRDRARRGVDSGASFASVASAPYPADAALDGGDAGARGATLRLAWDTLTGAIPPLALTELGLREGPSPTRDDPGWTPPKKVVVAGDDPARIAWLARVAPGVEIVPVRTTAEAVAAVADADAVVGFVTRDVLAAGTRLRWAQAGSAGVDRYVDLPALRERRIVLTNAQRIYGPEIAEHVLALLLAMTRGLDRAIPLQASGSWDRAAVGRDLVELRGRTLLVVGLGGIGTEVARLADGLGMRVLATRASDRPGPPFVARVGRPAELPDLVREADVVVNCTPLTPETTGLFDAALFAAMKPTAYFVNIGRGRSVDTDALVAALREHRIAGAGLDVTDPEPLPADHPLWKLPGVVVTPHVAARSDLAEERVWLLFRENLRRFASGERLLSVVDLERGY